MTSPEIKDRITQSLSPAEVIITDDDGNLIVSRPNQGIYVNICQDDVHEKKVSIYVNAPLSQIGLLPFLEWLGDHGYRYNYTGPNNISITNTQTQAL